MFSREVMQLYKSGATDPYKVLASLMQNNAEDDDEGLDEEEKAHFEELRKRFKPPNLTCF